MRCRSPPPHVRPRVQAWVEAAAGSAGEPSRPGCQSRQPVWLPTRCRGPEHVVAGPMSGAGGTVRDPRLLSPGEHAGVVSELSSGVGPGGRGCAESRAATVTAGLLPSADGSAQCLVGAGDPVLTNARATAVVVGVRGEPVHVPSQPDGTGTGPSSGPGRDAGGVREPCGERERVEWRGRRGARWPGLGAGRGHALAAWNCSALGPVHGGAARCDGDLAVPRATVDLGPDAPWPARAPAPRPGCAAAPALQRRPAGPDPCCRVGSVHPRDLGRGPERV